MRLPATAAGGYGTDRNLWGRSIQCGAVEELRHVSRWDRVAEQRLRVPMVAGSRSLNLSNAVAVAVFEAWRQQDYAGSWDAQPAAASGD